MIKTNARFMDNLEIFRSGDSGLLPMEVYFWTISMEIWEPHSSQGMIFLNYITMRNDTYTGKTSFLHPKKRAWLVKRPVLAANA